MQEDIKNKQNENPKNEKRLISENSIKEQEEASNKILNSVDDIKSNLQT